MAKGLSAKGSSAKGSSGGNFGTGIFGFFGTTINCASTDTSLYCNVMKLFNLLIVFIIVYYIVYTAYSFVSPYMGKRVRANR